MLGYFGKLLKVVVRVVVVLNIAQGDRGNTVIYETFGFRLSPQMSNHVQSK